MDSFKRFGEEKLPDKEYFFSSVKEGTTGDNGKKLFLMVDLSGSKMLMGLM